MHFQLMALPGFNILYAGMAHFSGIRRITHTLILHHPASDLACLMGLEGF